jgi:hypothetical protein
MGKGQVRFALVLALLALVVAAAGFTGAAQGGGTLAGKLNTLAASGLPITFQFRSAHADYDSFLGDQSAAEGTTLTVPFRSSDGLVNITLSEVGTDYVCFNETRSEVLNTRCIPFTDIASVSHPQ